MPWRFYPLDQQNCLALAKSICADPELDGDEGSTIVRLLAACGAMVTVTWLPEPDESARAKDAARRAFVDHEHVAATATAIQNLMLATKVRQIDSYWSSGGVLRDWKCYRLCGIPVRESLLGAIFLFPEDLEQHIDVRRGNLRDARGTPDQWRRWVKI
ncbi:MAG: hypothetical protein CSB47_01765 [Proteobacteria bacterium]|nr:MAG: hypothetical protein CSB47_01765 [Pseudomonadota bacterium]